MIDQDSLWQNVDDRLADTLLSGTDLPVEFEQILHANRDSELPAIDVSPLQGKLLHLFVKMTGAKRVLEIGTLGGYSTAWMGSALPEDGRLVTIECEAMHAGVAAANLKEAGLSDSISIRLGPAKRILSEMIADETQPFDFVFIDADKPSGATYFQLAMQLTDPGSVIICDNVVRQGKIIEPNCRDPDVIGTNELLFAIRNHPNIDATAIQTVGQKGHDGFVLARVVDEPEPV